MLIRLYGGWKFGGCGQCKFGGDYKRRLMIFNVMMKSIMKYGEKKEEKWKQYKKGI